MQPPEHPCVGGSIPPLATIKINGLSCDRSFFICAGVTQGLRFRPVHRLVMASPLCVGESEQGGDYVPLATAFLATTSPTYGGG